MAIIVSDWLKLKKNSETTNPKGFIVGTNNVCEVPPNKLFVPVVFTADDQNVKILRMD
jgi:hypothetical protein